LNACKTRISTPQTSFVLVRETKVESELKISSLIDGQKLFLEKYYIPSKDPYTGTVRISKRCVDANIIGKTLSQNGRPFVVSKIYLSRHKTLGGCPEDSQSSYVTYLIYYCNKTKKVTQGYFNEVLQNKSAEAWIQNVCE
jgi:hypothetical protein